ncbi:HemK/PrmC family methyltransferase [Candidatus Gromoviella agglomerans]|uniref:HemK/PrmC family methyltransferase n=1 Tax=Candidatus Gromoviella agglomerans TaxID=2806609 RepID=UPI001E5AE426|nr:HemK/PrmC family methyltransferase [Candidatus Gromoviella agglomerans]UFX98526.1 Protein-(glutamine-N5) methyltransferase [Candidatus Gromoviella agglomerans]
MTIAEFMNNALKMLKDAYLQRCVVISNQDLQIEVEQLLIHYLDIRFSEIFAHKEDQITNEDEIKLFALLSKMGEGMPLSKILNRKYFWNHYFYVNEHVLDPRQESELLVEKSISLLHGRSEVRILDLGTGSGCLSLSILDEIENAICIGVDISLEALNVAFFNAARLNLLDRLLLIHGDWFDFYDEYQLRSFDYYNRFVEDFNKFMRKDGQFYFHNDFSMPVINYYEVFDVIVANPPYISHDDDIDSSALYDPSVALFAQKNGIANYEIIIESAHLYLKKGGFLLLEIGHKQLNAVKKIIESNLEMLYVECLVDYAGYQRVVIAKRC